MSTINELFRDANDTFLLVYFIILILQSFYKNVIFHLFAKIY